LIIENHFIKLSNKKIFVACCLIIVLKFIFLSLFINEHQEIDPDSFLNFAHITKDYNYFLKPIENYFKNGFISYDGLSNFAGRLPGYWFPYLIMRFFLNKKISIIFLIITQIAISVFSNILFAKLVYRKTKKLVFFWISILVYSLNLFLLPFEYMTMTESLSVSTGVIGFYYFMKFNGNEKTNKKHLFIAGIMLAWMVFLRPFLVGFFSIPILCFILKKEIKYIILFIIPIIFMEVCWVARNYISMDKIIITTTSLNKSYGKIYSSSWIEIRKMISSWGEDTAYFEDYSLAHWFRRKYDDRDIEKILPKKALNNVNYTKEDIFNLRQSYIVFINQPNIKSNSNVDLEIAKTAKKYRIDYIQNHPFIYHLNLWSNLKYMLLRSGTSYLSINKDHKILYYCCKVYGTIYYSFFLIFGIVFILIGLIKKKVFYYTLSVAIISFLLIMVYYADIKEARYFLVPFTALIFCCLINLGQIKLKSKIS